MGKKSPVVSHFSSAVDKYIENWPERNAFALKAMKPFFKRQLRILELGCGTGHCLEDLSVHYPQFNLYGLDITPAMIKKARAIRPASVNFMLGDCLYSPFKSETFDTVIAYDLLHHLIAGNYKDSGKLREAVLRKMIELTKPQGSIIVEEVCVNTKWRSVLIFLFSQFLSRLHISIPSLNIITDVVVNFFTLNELDAVFEHLSLTIVTKEINDYKSFGTKLGTWISTFGSRTFLVNYVLRRN
jgi:SAM-dependent methyltransferase